MNTVKDGTQPSFALIKGVISINIKSVNEQYIFYKDGGCIKSRYDNLTRVLQIAKENIIFYDRMYDEINVYVEKQEMIVNNGDPGKEPHTRDFLRHIEWKQRLDDYINECVIFKAYADMLHDTAVKLEYWELILKQTERALILVKE